MKEHNKKKINLQDLSGKLIKVFNTVTDASRALGINTNDIHNCLNRDKTPLGKYTFSYSELTQVFGKKKTNPNPVRCKAKDCSNRVETGNDTKICAVCSIKEVYEDLALTGYKPKNKYNHVVFDTVGNC